MRAAELKREFPTFDLITPVIQGTGDIGVNRDANKELSEGELRDK